jgi:ABC-2 type transport system permease protein
MQRLLATIRKELLVLLRDRGGLAVLFVMPLVMITIMALIQDAPFRDYQELRIPLLYVNHDTGILGKTLEDGLKQSKIFQVHQDHLSENDAKKLIASGTYEIGIVVPPHASDSFKSNVANFVNYKMGTDDSTTAITSYTSNELYIHIFFAPGTKKSFKASVLSSLKQFTSKLSTFTMLDMFIKELGVTNAGSGKQEDITGDFVGFKEEDAVLRNQESFEMNSVQHNVPAWTIFGMFFIVLSMAGSLIKERDEGSYLRLRTMPGSYGTVMAGKVIAYLLICLIQCALMLMVGIYLMPVLGLPSLVIGKQLSAIVLIAVATGLAATGSGILVGTLFRTHQQSNTFGSVAIVILAALGGIWVPVYIMPDSIRTLAGFSPLYWSLQAFHNIFINYGTIVSIFPYALKLLLFFAVTAGISYIVDKNRFIK